MLFFFLVVLAACLEGSMTDFKLYFNNDALVPPSCYNKISESGQFIKNETFFIVLEAGSASKTTP